jgi:hypothetical protein
MQGQAMANTNDSTVAESLMALVRVDCERASRDARWADVLVWMASDLEAMSRELDLPEPMRADMRELAGHARRVTRHVRQGASAPRSIAA